MVSIPFIEANQQEQEEQNRYSLVVRFGKDILQDGYTALPNLLLDLYAELGITHCELVFLMHLLQYKWSRRDPYPALSTIAAKMGLSIRAVQNHVQNLKRKAFRCPHTQGQECDCPKYLEVTPRFTVCSGQTSNRYNLSNLFQAVVTLAREKGLIDSQEKNFTPQDEKICTPPVKKPAPESESAKQIQLESDESLSNGLEDNDEVKETGHSQAQETTSQPVGEREERNQASNENTVRRSPTNPPHPTTQAERSKSEVPPVKERPARRPLATGMSSIAEVIGKERGTKRLERTRELPRLSAPPLTQEEMDNRKRERLAREQRAQNPLPGIINDSDWQKLEADHPTQTTTKSKRQPVYEKLQIAIERISEELGDFKHVTSNITQAENIRKEANVSLEQFLVLLYEARSAAKHAHTIGRITKQDSTGQIVKMPYFYAVLRQKVGIDKKQGAL